MHSKQSQRKLDFEQANQDETVMRQFIEAVRTGQARVHLITGKLAERALRQAVADAREFATFQATIQVMPITVAALMPPRWIAARLQIPEETTHVVIPGFCDGDITEIQRVSPVPVIIGPRDLRDLPEWMTGRSVRPVLDSYDIEIIAEINFAPRKSLPEIIQQATQLTGWGADVIDVGCDPHLVWSGVGETVRALKNEGFRVSVDSFNTFEIEAACAAGAELVLSVNSSNRRAAVDWNCEVVAVPDQPDDWQSLRETIEFLTEHGVPYRIDPILEPIGLGLANSLMRYWRVRQTWPHSNMMMGIGNLSEMTDVDSSGVNVLLMGICQEWGIRSVLTTQVINWARSAVAECDWARRLVYHAVRTGSPPKRLMDQLIVLRDPKLLEYGEQELAQLASQIRDFNFRIFAERGELHVLGGGHHWRDTDPFALFDAILADVPDRLDASHAFYLGFELAKARLALLLGKQYTQDQPLRWGHLTPGP